MHIKTIGCASFLVGDRILINVDEIISAELKTDDGFELIIATCTDDLTLSGEEASNAWELLTERNDFE